MPRRAVLRLGRIAYARIQARQRRVPGRARAFRHYYPRDMQIAYYTRCIALRRVTRLARGAVCEASPRLGLTRHPRQLVSSPSRLAQEGGGGGESLKTHARHARGLPCRVNVTERCQLKVSISLSMREEMRGLREKSENLANYAINRIRLSRSPNNSACS